MQKNKRIVAIVLSLMMVLSVLPGMAFAETSGQNPGQNTLSQITAKRTQNLVDYNTASNSEILNKQGQPTGLWRIGQYGSTNVKQYFFHGADVEKENNGIADGNHVYANQYGLDYTVLTDISNTEYWDNYIQEKLDNKKSIEFGMMFSGTQAAWLGGSAPVDTYLLDELSLQTTSGDIIMDGPALFKELKKHEGQIKEPGTGAGGVGPARSNDVLLEIPANTLEPNTEYMLVCEAGMGTSGEGALDKKIVFHFSTAPIKVTSVTISNTAMTINTGQSRALTATVAPSDATEKGIDWSSSNNKVATVDAKGTVTAVNPGTATITAAAKDGSGAKASCRITAVRKTASIKMSSSTLGMKPGETKNLKTTISPLDVTEKGITWSSSNQKVAAVDANGKVTAKTSGDAVITATAKDGSGIKASCQIKVIGNVKAKAGSAGHQSVKLSWNKVDKADGYTVYRYHKKSKKYKAIKNTKKRSFTNTGLATGKKYTYKVRAYRTISGKKVYGNDSAKVSAKPIPATPKARAAAQKKKITVKWNKIAGTTKYVVYKSTKKNSGYYKARITVNTSFKDTSVKRGKTYYYKVRSYKKMDGRNVYGRFSKTIKARAK